VTQLKLEGKTVCVAGGAGFIGSHLCDKLIEHRPERIVIVDDFSLGKESNLSKLIPIEWSRWPREFTWEPAFEYNNVVIYGVDASRYKAMRKIYKRENIDVTFNLAVIPLPASLEEPKRAIDVNILIISNLCDLLQRGYYDTLIHTSSSEAYGTAIFKEMNENHPTRPITPYAASKLACDHIALSYHLTFGLDIAIARPFNCYGPRQNEKSYAAVIPITISRILAGESPIIHGDGQQTRDFSYVEDLAEVLPKIYELPSTRGRVINLATGKETSIHDLIHMIMKLMDYSGPVINEPSRPGDVRRHCGDISLACRLMNYAPKTGYEEGLRRTIEWYRKSR